MPGEWGTFKIFSDVTIICKCPSMPYFNIFLIDSMMEPTEFKVGKRI